MALFRRRHRCCHIVTVSLMAAPCLPGRHYNDRRPPLSDNELMCTFVASLRLE
jgi:hypothetical protein